MNGFGWILDAKCLARFGDGKQSFLKSKTKGKAVALTVGGESRTGYYS